uniref:Uncharacterized protein n=1 Tax=Arion vulgaris TaxID=1028688 RepID=A0A0B7AR85_9EUPU
MKKFFESKTKKANITILGKESLSVMVICKEKKTAKTNRCVRHRSNISTVNVCMNTCTQTC